MKAKTWWILGGAGAVVALFWWGRGQSNPSNTIQVQLPAQTVWVTAIKQGPGPLSQSKPQGADAGNFWLPITITFSNGTTLQTSVSFNLVGVHPDTTGLLPSAANTADLLSTAQLLYVGHSRDQVLASTNIG